MYALLLTAWITGMSSGAAPTFFPATFDSLYACEHQWNRLGMANIFTHKCVEMTAPDFAPEDEDKR